MSKNALKVVVIEDDPQIRRFLRTGLGAEGFEVFEAENGKRGLIECGTRKPDLVVLDLGLPDMEGVDVIRDLRAWSGVPVIVLSARVRENDKITALDAGADDYLVKPFGIGELLARMRVALRHAATIHGADDTQIFDNGELRVDLAHRVVQAHGAVVHLTPLEFRLLAALVKQAGKVLTHTQLLREVWGPAHVEQHHYVRIYMGQLRHKLEADPAQPRFLLSEPGVGYRLKGDE